MPESQLVKYSEQKSQDYLTDKTREGKSFLKNQRTPATLAFKRIIIIIIIIIIITMITMIMMIIRRTVLLQKGSAKGT